MSIVDQANAAARWSQLMTDTARRAADPSTVRDPAKLAEFQIEMFNASSGYQLTARTIQDLHREDQILGEMLRDA